MCMAPVISAANVRAVAPETMNATSVALPEENINDTSTKIKRAEEQASGADTYWWGTASQATVKIGDAITGISDRHSVIFDSPIEEGYENKKTSAYFEVDTSWTAFDMGKQDLMFYIELPEAATGLRMKHICADSWGKWPAPAGMKYQYLAADGATWQENVIDENNEIRLTAGFKGYVRLLLNTAVNCESYADATVKLQFFAFRIGAYGGSYGAAKLGGVWFASKGEAYKVSVDGGEAVKLTTAEPQPSTGDETPAWTGDVLTATVPAEESAAVGEDSAWFTWSDKKWGAVPKVTMKAGEAITPIGAQKSVVLDSPKLEGYKSGGEENSYPVFKVSMNNSQLNIAEQDVMFYLELPVGTTSIRLDGISLSGGTMTPAAGNLPYQYLTMDSKTWVGGVTDGNKQIELVDGFKGYVRLRISEASDWWWQGHDSTDASWKTETRPMDNFTFHCARFGGEAGALKFGGVWFVSKEATRYIKVGEGETVRMTTPIDATWITATSVYKETAAVGEASAVTTCTDEGWGRAPKSTSIVGETINILNDGQKSLVIDSEQHEGYHLDDGSERSHGKFDVATDNVTFDMATQELMLYIEMPESAESLRLSNVFFSNGGTLSPYTSDGLTYDYLPIDGNEWVKDQKIDANSQITLPAGFKGYVRIDVTGATGWWWQYHGNSGENDAWKTQTATLTNIRFKLAKFGGGLGAFKLGGIWIVSKEDFTDISVNGADALAMTTYDAPEPVMQATSVAVEADPVSTWDSKVSYTDSDSWKTIDSKAQITLGESITKISDRKSVVIDSEIPEGYHNDGTTTWPLFRVATSATMNADKQDLMFYVELPATMSSLRIQDVTCQGWSFWLAPAGVQFKYLAMDSNDWVDGTITTEGNKQLNLPQGFKGYVRLVLSSAGNYEKLGENAAILKIDALHFRAERFGGELGALKIGGVWFVSKTDTYMVSVDGGEAVKLTNAPDPTPDPDPGPDPEPERDYLLGTVPNQETADIGADSSLVTMNKNDKFWGIESQATATAAEGINIIDGQKAVIIDSPIEEGFGNSKTSTQYTVSCGWTNLDLKTQDLMFYVEMPATGSGKSSLRIWDLTCDNWSFWVNTRGMQYQYLAIDGSEWVNGAAPLDEDNKQLDLPDGFKGYVRLKIDTAKNVADKETLKVQSFSFYAGTFGGDYGPMKIGGVWFVSKEEYIKIKVDNGEVLKMTNASDPGPVDPVDPVDPDDPNRDYIIGSIPARETAANDKTSRLVTMDDGSKWWGIPTQSTLVAGDPITIIGDQKSVIIDSPILEGYENKRTSALYMVNCGWTDLDLKTQDVMFYIEMPTSGRGSSGLRLWDLACDSYTFWVNTRGMKYQYLSMDSKEWVDGQIGTDDNKQIDLPDGFKGYVRLKVDTAANTADKETLKIQTFSFRPGTFGAEYGPIKFGGVWFVTKENFCYIRVDGAAKKVMTTYWQHNDELLDEFHELIEKLTDKDLSAAPTVDRLQSLYESMSEEYRGKVTQEELDKLNEYAAVIEAYRPEFIGATLKKYGSKPQSAKIGWTVDEALAKKGGYKVVSSGAVMLFGRNYDGKSLIDETTPTSVKMTGKTASGYCYATTDIEAGDYKQAMLLRCYVVYEDSKTGKQYTVWCGMYTDKSGQTTPYMKCSLYEVAAYFGVPLYAN